MMNWNYSGNEGRLKGRSASAKAAQGRISMLPEEEALPIEADLRTEVFCAEKNGEKVYKAVSYDIKADGFLLDGVWYRGKPDSRTVCASPEMFCSAELALYANRIDLGFEPVPE